MTYYVDSCEVECTYFPEVKKLAVYNNSFEVQEAQIYVRGEVKHRVTLNEMDLIWLDVEYNNEKVLPCSENTKLLPGESRMCYQIYSYAGKGEYLINQATDLTYENWKSYLLTIE